MSDHHNYYSKEDNNKQTLEPPVMDTFIDCESVAASNLIKLPTKFGTIKPGHIEVDAQIMGAYYFLRDFSSIVTIRDPTSKKFVKKTAFLYHDKISYLSTADPKIINIDYEHLTDWVSALSNKISNICKKYGFDYPVVDVSKLDRLEIIDLGALLYARYLLKLIEADGIEEFQQIIKHGVYVLFQEKFDPTFREILSESNNDVLTRQLQEMHIGITHFPIERELHDIRSDMLNKLVTIKGDLDSFDATVRFEITKSAWRCEACNVTIPSHKSSKPKMCINCKERSAFTDLNRYETRDYVYMKISQHVNSEDTLIGMSDMVIKVEGGNLIKSFWKQSRQSAALKVVGVVKPSEDRLNKNNPDERTAQVNALSIEVEGESTNVQYNEKLLEVIANRLDHKNIKKHYEKLKRSICPHLYELWPVKEAVLLMLAGAVARLDRNSKRRVRGDLNVMIVGDSGMGKSEFGTFICKCNPYAIRTVGGSKTTTAASLTSSMVTIKDVKVISKGVLPRCDIKGIAIIDELDKRDAQDMQVLSIPLDDNQMIPTHKADYHHDIPARCPVLLLGNASKNNGKWDPSKSIIAQTNYGTWLVDRTDLIFVLVDDGDLERKEKMVEHMARSRAAMVSEADYNKSFKNRIYSDTSIEKIESDFLNGNFEGVYDTEYIRHEMHYLKNTYKPLITPGSTAEDHLRREYLKFSQIHITTNNGGEGDEDFDEKVMGARAYNGMERIAMSIARVMRHHTVTFEDAEMAVHLMFASISSMLLRPKQQGDKLKDENAGIYKQMRKMLGKEGAVRKLVESESEALKTIRIQEKRKFRAKLTRFTSVLCSLGFDRCKDCGGKGIIKFDTGKDAPSEMCMECKGNGVHKKSFSFSELQVEMSGKHKVMYGKELKDSFEYYKKIKAIVAANGKDRWKPGFDKIDSIFLGDTADALAEIVGHDRAEEERLKLERNLSTI